MEYQLDKCKVMCIKDGNNESYYDALKDTPQDVDIVFLNGVFNTNNMDKFFENPRGHKIWFVSCSFDNLHYTYDCGECDKCGDVAFTNHYDMLKKTMRPLYERNQFIAHSDNMQFLDCHRYAYDDHHSRLYSCNKDECAWCLKNQKRRTDASG